LRSSNIKDFEKEEKQFLSKYTLTGSNNAQSNLFEDREDGVSNIMSEAYQKPSENIGAILSCSLLVTGNTVGAGTMVLPDVASGPGMFPSLLVFIGLYVINVLSGIIIGEVSIQQYEKSSESSASSFKALAEGMFNSKMGGIAIAWVSIIINWCVLAFDLKRGGTLAIPCLAYCNSFFSNLDPNFVVGGLATFLIGVVFAQSEKELSNIASKAGTVLSASFVAVLVSGMLGMQENPIFIPGTESNMFSAVCYAAPIFLTAMIYQNIVPTVAKLVNYDRFKLNTSLVLGSGLPLVMYVGYCLASLGGGISLDASSSMFGAFVPICLNTFFYSAVVASTITCSISLAEEFQSLLGNSDNNTSDSTNEDNSLPSSESDVSNKLQSTVYAIFPPFLAGVLFSHSDTFNDALSIAGSFFSPFLYGILPVLLAMKLPEANIPGGKGSLALLGVSTLAFMGLQVANDIGVAL